MSDNESVEVRRYSVTGILGQGGFGTVYKGRLDGDEGFVKEVAIKLLTEEDPDEEVLARFRDEARILGLLRDRNIVSVDPPTRLGGRWAVVMEFVDGAACDRLLRAKGAMPCAVALEIVEEVARTLDNLWTHPGADGAPMHLLHRDLKPANLQITPNGQVKVLDFGIAKANFSQRETRTTDHIGGTVGYIAPERLEGEEGPKGDVYSLGVVLHELVTNARPRPGRRYDMPEEADVAAVVELAARMRELEPEDRPDAREVEKACREIRAKVGGLDLRDWAKENVPHASTVAPDELVGQHLTETLRGIPRMPESLPSGLEPRRRGKGVFLGASALLLMMGGGAVGIALIAAVAGGGLYLYGGSTDASVAEVVQEVPAEQAEIEVPDPVPEAATVDPVDPPTEVTTTPAPPVAAPGPAPALKPVTEQAPEPEPESAATGTVTISGDADSVWFTADGSRFEAGSLAAGSYEIQAVFAGKEVHAGTVTVSPGGAYNVKCNAGFKRCQIK